MAIVQVYDDFLTDLGPPATHTWVDVAQDRLPLEVVLFVAAVEMGVRETMPDGQFWYERGEVHTKTSANGSARLYRLVP